MDFNKIKDVPNKVVDEVVKKDDELVRVYGKDLIEEQVKRDIDEFIRLNEQVKELTKRLEEYRDRVKHIFEERKCDVITSDVEGQIYEIVMTKTIQKRFDSNAFKKDYADLYDKYKKDLEVVRIDVKKLS